MKGRCKPRTETYGQKQRNFPLKNVRPTIRQMIMEELWDRQLAKTIFDLREKSGLSIQQVAERAHVPVSTIQRLESANPGRVILSQLFRIVHAIGGALTVVRLIPRWFALVHQGRILQETFAVDEADAFTKFRTVRGKLPTGATVEKSTGKNRLETDHGKI